MKKKGIKIFICGAFFVVGVCIGLSALFNVWERNYCAWEYYYEHPNGADYSVGKEGERGYLVFDDLQKYLDYYKLNARTSVMYPEIPFNSIKDLQDTVLRGKLSKRQRTQVALFDRDDKGRIATCDFHNLYEPKTPLDVEVYRMFWKGETYLYELDYSNGYGRHYVYSEDSYDYWYQQDYVDFVKNTYNEITKTEQSKDKTIIYYQHQQDWGDKDITYWAKVRYTLKRGDKTVYVDKTYSLDKKEENIKKSDIPSNITLYCEEEKNSVVELWDFNKNPSDAWLLKFGLKKYIDIENMLWWSFN